MGPVDKSTKRLYNLFEKEKSIDESECFLFLRLLSTHVLFTPKNTKIQEEKHKKGNWLHLETVSKGLRKMKNKHRISI